MKANDILKLSSIATEYLGKKIVEQVSDKNNPLKEIIPRAHYIEYYFNDGALLEIAVVRDFNDDMNPTHVVLNGYEPQVIEGLKVFNRYYTERFKVS